MLQQTRVATVIPYYERFLRRFPTVRSLARAELQDVLKAWEGLGYYARARNLHRAAGLVPPWPRSSAEWKRLPGVGSYTAAAIASIVNGERVAVEDGNVRRVASRLLGRPGPVPAEWVPASAPGDFNQALMELGQTICRPRRPRCPSCPLRSECVAYRKGIVARLAPTRKKREVPHYRIGIGVVRRRGRLLIGRRPPRGLLGGLWEFPGGKRKGKEPMWRCVVREVREETGLRVRVVRKLPAVRHAYSHFRVTLHPYECRVVGGSLRPRGIERLRWVRPADLRRYPFPAANARIFRNL